MIPKQPHFRQQDSQILAGFAGCMRRFFIVKKSVVMEYNKLLNYAGVTGDSINARFGCGA
jgi:hypothetical protein